MKKRVAAALLWFTSAWYAWAIAAHFLGLSVLGGPVLGAALAAVIAGDPMHRIWDRKGVAAGMVKASPAGVRQLA